MEDTNTITSTENNPHHLTKRIAIGMLAGMVVGLLLKGLHTYAMIPSLYLSDVIIHGGLTVGSRIFIAMMQMLVVPIVFLSLVCGVCSLKESTHQLSKLSIKAVSLYALTTSLAIALGLMVASSLPIGVGANLTAKATITMTTPPSITDTLVNLFPTNPLAAMVHGEMLQVIVFALLLGTAISLSGKKGEWITPFFQAFNDIMMNLLTLLMKFTPYGVFCLLAALFAQLGFKAISELASYFFTVLLVLFIHLFVSNSLLLRCFAGMNPWQFFKKMSGAMLFAFSTSSSTVSIPIVLNTVEKKLGVNKAIAAFTIPLGATINMDGTAIMQGVATVFIANAYQIHLHFTSYLMVIFTATLASIGTAGVPGVGLITLMMVLQQIGLPAEGIQLIIGIDRLLDMVRTAVNVTGDAAVTCVIARSENKLST